MTAEGLWSKLVLLNDFGAKDAIGVPGGMYSVKERVCLLLKDAAGVGTRDGAAASGRRGNGRGAGGVGGAVFLDATLPGGTQGGDNRLKMFRGVGGGALGLDAAGEDIIGHGAKGVPGDGRRRKMGVLQQS